jgi:hypothetical protein
VTWTALKGTAILFAHAEKTADADDERGGLALPVDEHVHDLADLAVVGVIDALLVPVGDGHAVGWNLDII